MPAVKPEILKWARETAGLSVADAAHKVGLRAARGVDPVTRLEALEQGEQPPSRALLARMAKQYRRPLVTFYLDSPPKRTDRGHDFRTTTSEAPEGEEALLDALIRSVLARQSLIRAALEAEDDVEQLDFVGASRIEQGSTVVAAELARVLQFDSRAFRRARTLNDAFALLRERAEAVGVFVLLIGDLGSHHTEISPKTFRGYAIADPIAPFIVINDRDGRAAWSFTLLHEFCHLLLGYSGVSDVYGSTEVEKFCNDVASTLLVGDQELQLLIESLNTGESPRASLISAFAKERNVSSTLVAYRAYKLGAFSFTEFSGLRRHFFDQWQLQRERVREISRAQEGGPTYYIVRRHRIGNGLLGAVGHLLRSGAFTTTRAGQVLGVKPKNVSELLSGTSAASAS